MRTAGDRLAFGSNQPDNERKLQELILYIVERAGEDPRFGATKLNKILFWSDFFAYANMGEAITGVEYMRLPNGPVPRRLVPVRDRLVNAGDLEMSYRDLFNGRRQTRFTAKRRANLDLFTPAQIDLVNEIIEYLRAQTAAEVSNGSHNRAWQIASNGDGIPYQAVYIGDRGIVQSDIASAKALSSRFGWAERFAAA